jgi:hypothetical protein
LLTGPDSCFAAKVVGKAIPGKGPPTPRGTGGKSLLTVGGDANGNGRHVDVDRTRTAAIVVEEPEHAENDDNGKDDAGNYGSATPAAGFDNGLTIGHFGFSLLDRGG